MTQTVTIRKLLSASREEVFDAWLDPEGMRTWMCPPTITGADVELDPRVGGQFRIVMKGPDADIVNTGEYRVLDRPEKLQFTWVSTRWANQETLVTVELREQDTQCELILTHERFPMPQSPRQLEGGWNEMLNKFARYLAAPRGELRP